MPSAQSARLAGPSHKMSCTFDDSLWLLHNYTKLLKCFLGVSKRSTEQLTLEKERASKFEEPGKASHVRSRFRPLPRNFKSLGTNSEGKLASAHLPTTIGCCLLFGVISSPKNN